MRLRKSILLLAIPALLLGAGISAWNWLLHSESGARWLFGKLQSSKAFSLGVDTISGDLGSGLHVQGLLFENESLRLQITEAKAAINIDLLPPAVNLELLHSDAIVIRSLQSGEQPPGQATDLRDVFGNLSLPIPLHVHDVRLDHIEYVDAVGQSLIEVQSVEVRGGMHKSLALHGAEARVKGHEIVLEGQLGLQPPHSLELQFGTSGEFSATGQLTGSLEQVQLEIDNLSPAARLTGSLHDVLASPGWDLELTAPDLRWPLDEPEPEARMTRLKLRSHGNLSGYSLELDGSLLLPGLEPSLLLIEGSGSSTQFSASRIGLDGPEFALESRGEISWQQDLAVSLDANLERLNPVTWIKDWPEDHPVAGELALQWSGDEIAVPRFRLAVSGTPVVASGSGLFDLPSGVVDGQLAWQELSWPLAVPDARFGSRQGQLHVGGSPDDWRIDGSLEIQAAGFPEGRLQLGGTGNLESLEMQVHEAAIMGGALAGEVSFNWTGHQPFQASLRATDIQLEALLEQYPGSLSTELSASGQLQPLAVNLDIQRLDGKVRQVPFDATGGIHYDDGEIQANSLNVSSGTSTLHVNGSPYQPGGIEFAASIDSLSEFSTDFAGTLSASGRLSLDPGSPSISGSLSAQQLKLASIGIDEIQTINNELVMTGLEIGDNSVDSLTFSFSPGKPLEQLGITAAVKDRTITLQFEGAVDDWAKPLDSGWKGRISGFELQKDQFLISLDQAAPLEVGGDRFELQDACLTGSRNARLCLAASWRKPDVLSFSTDLTSIPLSVVELFMETDVRFSQVLSGTLNWTQKSGGSRSGDARVTLSPGDISLEGEDDLSVETGPGLFAFEVTDGRLRQGILNLAFPGSGEIDVDFSAADLREGAGSPIQGNARIDLHDIGLVGRLVPVIDTSEGVVDVDLALGGTIADPTFNGRASITNGKIENRASGFSFTDINITGEVNELDEAFLNGRFGAGEGTGNLDAKLVFNDMFSPEFELELTGENLTVIDVPDLKAIANPDLRLSWRDSILEIDGRLIIPTVRLAPSYIPKASVGQSEDVVIVAGELPETQQNRQQENTFRMQGHLEVELGEDVVVDLDIAQIDVTGGARFNWRDELIPIADGSFNATGDIQAFGQFLRVTQGRVSFPDVPADNPHLNIRAEREIFGNSQIRRAGLMVAGTLKRPVVEPYTVPMTNKDRARTLLVTGSDFNYEQGVGAVDVGMYVLPRLYVSYGIGVFEDGNVLKVRYDLGRGFGVRATSGQRETGLDISYTIDR